MPLPRHSRQAEAQSGNPAARTARTSGFPLTRFALAGMTLLARDLTTDVTRDGMAANTRHPGRALAPAARTAVNRDLMQGLRVRQIPDSLGGKPRLRG